MKQIILDNPSVSIWSDGKISKAIVVLEINPTLTLPEVSAHTTEQRSCEGCRSRTTREAFRKDIEKKIARALKGMNVPIE